jgi:hypothetical protein
MQELCWAKHVVYIIGEVEISTDGIFKSFEMAREFVHSLDHSFEPVVSSIFGPMLDRGNEDDDKFRKFRNWGSTFGPIWSPQIFYGMSNYYERGVRLSGSIANIISSKCTVQTTFSGSKATTKECILPMLK